MITVSNFRDVLATAGFTSADGQRYEKEFPHLGAVMNVDFSAQKLSYPDRVRGRERNTGFNAPENFVVFECVARLLEKGYRPEHIELEKEWPLGRTAKSGRADICVEDADGSLLFIIECKTWGREYDKALKDTERDGAQLFSYWQQEQACRWLVLYASDSDGGTIRYKAPVISCSDDPNILLLAEKDSSIKLFRNAKTVPERYEAWKETYGSRMYDDLVFSDDSTAYKIGARPLRKKDLRDFSPEDRIVNQFEEILRHNNVSDKENAFNRLTALFICKIVDESTKGEEDEVEFQYKQGTDTYETLQDRLQRLHRDGMEIYMREKVYYVSADYPERLFSTYTGSRRKKAIEDLKNTIRILKFYSNNDFAFKDVHNEELFYQNGKILVEMVQLFEKYRIVYPSKHQFLGDLFEQLLNKGFRQNEGQFFTPMPITRFIWDSLPVERMVKSGTGTAYPKTIDYACGAGHFLTEAVEAINFHAGAAGDNAWTGDHIYGIEKDYRLARVARISLFMNGAGEGNIIFGDGLENAPDAGIDNGTFDILVANPPYSVKDFRQHLQLKSNSFVLLDRIGPNSGEIEVLFVERISQLLKPRGVAAVILPVSILSNSSSSYTGAREMLLQGFYLRAVVSFGSKTFGATGTNTAALFLEKFDEPPRQADLCSDSVEAILNGGSLSGWEDKDILRAYAEQVGVGVTGYMGLIKRSLTLAGLKAIGYFDMYEKAFAGSAAARSIREAKGYAEKTPAEQEEAYLGALCDYILPIEREKLLYFSLVYKHRTLIITAPADNEGQKEFLGYDWSNRKGSEGIRIISPGGKLYDDADRMAEGTLAHAIRQSFDGAIPALTAEQQAYAAVVDTKDMLDFSRETFDKSLRLNVKKKGATVSRYPLLALGEICNITIGGTPSRTKPEYFAGNNLWVSIAEMQGQVITDTKEKITDEAIVASNVKLVPAGTTLLSFKLSIGKTAIAGRDLYTNEAIAALIPSDSSQILDKYLYYIFKGGSIDLETFGDKAFGKSLNSKYLREEVRIPVPPLDIQRQIIEECNAVEEEREKARASIVEGRQKIEDLFTALDTAGQTGAMDMTTLDKVLCPVKARIRSDSISPSDYVTTDTMLKDCGGIVGYVGDIPAGTVIGFKTGDILVSNIRPYLKKAWHADKDGGCSPDILVFRVMDASKADDSYVAHAIERDRFFDHVMQDVKGAKMPRGKKEHILSYGIPLPDLTEQEKVMRQVSKLEDSIQSAEKTLNALSGKTGEILKRYLG